nr:MAG TPA: hypothetical protein [Caudoviricetes sp.]
MGAPADTPEGGKEQLFSAALFVKNLLTCYA